MIKLMAAHAKKTKAKGRAKAPLTEEAARKLVLKELGKMSQAKLFKLAQRAGIYTRAGKLTRRYRDDAEPAA
ncbi:MAG TPA: hypothetical protein VGL81_23535 [Polyangiaceae bacterium]|jgi:ribosomal protein L17